MNYKIVIIISLIFLFIANRYCAVYGQHNNYIFIFDEQIGQEKRTAIIDGYHADKAEKIPDKDIIKNLVVLFPGIKNISMSYFPLATVIKISAHQPWYIINNSDVMLANHCMVSSSFFSPSLREILLSATIAPALINSPEVIVQAFERLSQMSQTSGDFGGITMLNKNKICVSFKDDPYCTIVYATDVVIPQTLCDHYAQIKNTFLYEKSMPTKWVLDVRFAHFIVAYKA
jgi:hypothetical protein